MDPTHLGPYTIKSRLGRGGMGSVYEAEDSLSGRTVAVKTLITQLDENTSLRRRFQAEIEALKALRHPGIVQLLAYGEEGGQPYFAMELVRGRSLEQMLRDGRRFSWRETISVALAIVKALKYAHDNGVIHRDLKPANLLLAPADDPPGTRSVTVKLADFGIARLFGDTNQTMAGTIVGTAEYMSPEQARGDHVDPRTDIYALGLVMFAMLAGRPPFHGGRAMQLIERQKHEPPPRVAGLVADVPPALDELIDRMLAKDPARRPPNALALSKLLTHVVTLVTTDTTGHDPPAAHPRGERPAGGTTPLHTRPPQTVAPAVEPTRPQQARAAKSPAPVAPPPGKVNGRRPDRPAADLLTETRDMPGRAARTERPTSLPPTQPPAVGGKPPASPQWPHEATTPEEPEEGGWNGPYRETRHVEVEDLDRRERQREASRRLWQAIAAGIAFAAISTVIGVGSWLILRTPTADELMTRIETRIDGNASRVDALKDSLPDLEQFLTLYADDPRAEQVRGFVREVEIDRLARRARLRERKPEPPYLRIEREYRQAMALQPTEPKDCLDALRAILRMPRDDLSQPLSAAPDDDLVRDFELWLELVRAKIKETLPLVRADDRAQRQDAARLEGAETPVP